jgi:hypothetical protein
MSRDDFDRNGPNEDELRDLLRSLPREQAPESLEPDLMRRVAGMRRSRMLFGVLHTAARPEWFGGLVSAAAAAVIVAGGWFYFRDGIDPRMIDPRPAQQLVTGSDAGAARAIAPSRATTASSSTQTPLLARSERPSAASTSRRSAASVPTMRHRRPLTLRASSSAPEAIDTIAAARLALHPAPSELPTSTEAGMSPSLDRSSTGASADCRDDSSGADTGGSLGRNHE